MEKETTEREWAGQEAIRLYNEQIQQAKELVTTVTEKLRKDIKPASKEEWEGLQRELDKTVLVLSGLEEMGMLIQEQKGLLNKLKAQQEYVRDKVLRQFEKAARKAA